MPRVAAVMAAAAASATENGGVFPVTPGSEGGPCLCTEAVAGENDGVPTAVVAAGGTEAAEAGADAGDTAAEAAAIAAADAAAAAAAAAATPGPYMAGLP